jgi:nucleoside-diphosphate-sugar epimerase
MLAGDTCNLGVGWPVSNFLFIDDLVELYRVLLDKLPLGETFVTGPDNAVTIGELVDTDRDKLDWHGTVNWDTVPERAAEVPYLNSDPAKAKRLLGWEPQVSLMRGWSARSRSGGPERRPSRRSAPGASSVTRHERHS